MPPDSIRWATPADAAGLAEVHVVAWQRAYRGILGDDFLDSMDFGSREAWWAGYLGRGARVSVSEREGMIVGFCNAGASSDAGWGEIFAIYVHPDHWGTGLGRELMVAGESSLVASGFDRALLWVLEENRRARDFYERRGWSQGGPIKIEDIGGTQVNEVRYQKDLRAPS
jgi:ribosomal protein S18 acetylase RimI-like enzyme